MGLFEWLFERHNPGPVGTFERNEKAPKPPKGSIVLLRLIICAGVIGLLFNMIIGHQSTVKDVMVFIGVIFLYCVISYYIVPKPDYSNVGWFGGLVDNPFRYSDDLNRILILFMVILYPGRFLAQTMVQAFYLIRKR